MNNPFADTLHLSVQPSAIHRVLVVVLHLCAIGIVAFLALSRPWFWLLVPVIAAVGALCERGAALQRPASVHRLRWQTDHYWRWQRVDGRWCEGRLVHSFCLGDAVVVLGLRETRRRLRSTHCVLFRDAVGAAGHRHLRARLSLAPDPRAERAETV